MTPKKAPVFQRPDEVSSDLLMRIFVEVSEATGDLLSETFEAAMLNALSDAPTAGVAAKKSIETALGVWKARLVKVKDHPNWSEQWVTPLAATITGLWVEMEFPGHDDEDQLEKLQGLVAKYLDVSRAPEKTPDPRSGEASVQKELESLAKTLGEKSLDSLLSTVERIGGADKVLRAAERSDTVGLQALGALKDLLAPKRDARAPGTPDLISKLLDRIDKGQGRASRRGRRSRSPSSSRSSSRSRSYSPDRRSHRRQKARAFDQLSFFSKDPVKVLQSHSGDIKRPRDWPIQESSVAPWLIPQIYASSRRAKDWAADWTRDHFVRGSPTGMSVMRYALFIDMLVLYDADHVGVNPFALASVEVICRDLYGILKAHERVECEDDVRPKKSGAKSKVLWKLRDRYDLAALGTGNVTAPDADREVAKVVKRDSQAMKLLRDPLAD